MVQKNHEVDHEIHVIFAAYGCFRQFHIVQKIHHIPKSGGKGYAFKDFIPACVQKVMEAAEGENEKDSAGNE
jgi:hypothetical protein